MDEDNTLRLNFTGNDRRKIRDQYEQTIKESERKKIREAIQGQLKTWQSLLNAIMDLNNSLLVISTLVLFESWLNLHDERLIKEIGGTHQLIEELSKGIGDPELVVWKKRLQIVVSMYLTGLRLYIQQDRKTDLQSVVRQIGMKPLQIPIISLQGVSTLSESSDT